MNPGWPPHTPPAAGVPGTAAAVATTGQAVRLWALPPHPPCFVPCSLLAPLVGVKSSGTWRTLSATSKG